MDVRLPSRFSPGERVSRRVVFALDVLDGPVAVKVARDSEAARAAALSREFGLLAELRHPAFPRPASFGFQSDGRAWLSMARVGGEVPVGPMAWPELARLADGACEALEYLHERGLIHQDLKPDHLRFDATTGRVMVLDLGAACPAGAPAPRVGTPGFVAPECLAGHRADPRGDVYSLGAVLHELATGRPAFTGTREQVLAAQREGRCESVGGLRADAPVAFTRLVARMLSRDPGQRPATAGACREALAQALGTVSGSRLGSPGLTGRDRELDTLLACVERARHAAVSVVLAGREGSGRSTLLETLRCRSLLDGHPVVCWSLSTGWQIGALGRHLSAAIDATLPSPSAISEPVSEARTVLEAAVASLAGSDVQRAPIVLLLDDASAADAATRAHVREMSEQLPAGVLLVVADDPRPEALAPAATLRLDLAPLAELSVRQLAAAAARRMPDDDVVETLLAGSRQPGEVLFHRSHCDAVVEHAEAAPPDADAASPASPRDADPASLLRAGRIAGAVAAWHARLTRADLSAVETARALAGLGEALWAMAEPADALSRAEAALALAAREGEPLAEAEAARVLGRIFASFGSTRDAVGWERRALELAAVHRDVPRHGALLELGSLMLREGHVDAAVRALGEAVVEAERLGHDTCFALGRARLGRARLVAGDMGRADADLVAAVAAARASGDRLVEIEASRLLGTACCLRGEMQEGLLLLEHALSMAIECGFQQELPAVHEALAQASLRRCMRLRTHTGAIVDRRELELARAHVEKGLDLALATARVADRAALRVLEARCALLQSDGRGAQAAADAAHRLAIEAGDLLVASQARLVKAEALLDLREFGIALAEARIAAEALDRSGDLESAWQAHALLARIHGAWGMAARQVQETEIAARLLERLAASLPDARCRRQYLADVDRASALAPPACADGTNGANGARARRGIVPELEGSRFAGRADTEDLVEALITSRKRIDQLERRARATSAAVRQARVRRDAMLLAAALSETGEDPRSKDLARVLELVARACNGARVVVATVQGSRLRARGMTGHRAQLEGTWHEAALAVARRVVDEGRGSVALGPVPRRRTDAHEPPLHVALPLVAEGRAFGALVVRPNDGGDGGDGGAGGARGAGGERIGGAGGERIGGGGGRLRKADLRLLRAVAALLSRALCPAPAPAVDRRTASV